MKTLFTKQDIGCHADGTFGNDHCRNVLQTLLDDVGRSDGFEPSEQLTYIAEIRRFLMADPSDDFSEEDEAIEILQSVTDDNLQWVMESGDLLLIEIS